MNKVLNNSFEALAKNQRKGVFMTDLSEAIQRAVMGVREHTKGASVTVILKIEPASGDGDALSVQDEIRVKLPEPKRPKTLFYSTEEGRLVRDNPNQQEMALKVVEEAPVAEPVKLARAK